MRVDNSHTYLNNQSAQVESHKARASLDVREMKSGTTRWSWDQKDTLTLSDGAKVHIAESISGKEGVGDGSRYKKIVSFLRNALEQSLGTSIENIDIGDLEVDQVKKTLMTKSATPREYPVGDMLSYRMSKSKVSVEVTHTTVEGTVLTKDGKELQFSLDLEILNESGSTKQMTYRGTGDAAKDPPILVFDGVARELTSLQFKFDSNGGAGEGAISFKDESTESAGSGFRRYQWYA